MVYNNSLDDIIGYAHFFDLFKKPKNIRSILLPIEIVPETMCLQSVRAPCVCDGVPFEE